MSIVLQGSTSGSVTLQEPAVAGTTVLTLPAVSGTLITTASSGQSIPKAALPTGSVLQVVSTTKTDSFSSNSTSFVDVTGFSASITPTSATSKILVFGTLITNTLTDSIITFQLVRGSTDISIGGSALTFRGTIGNYLQSNTADSLLSNAFHFLDSPATTSSTTYKVQMKTNQVRTFFVNNRPNNDASYTSTITVMEIAA
jgi:hypothetical protein